MKKILILLLVFSFKLFANHQGVQQKTKIEDLKKHMIELKRVREKIEIDSLKKHISQTLKQNIDKKSKSKEPTENIYLSYNIKEKTKEIGDDIFLSLDKEKNYAQKEFQDDQEDSVSPDSLVAYFEPGKIAPIDSTIEDFSYFEAICGDISVFQAEGLENKIGGSLEDLLPFASFVLKEIKPEKDSYIEGIFKKDELEEHDVEIGTFWGQKTQFSYLVAESGKLGLEDDYGNKYWRSFDYEEDSSLESQVKIDEDTEQSYWTKLLAGDDLALRLRHTYLDNNYTGENSIFLNFDDKSKDTQQ